MITVFCDTKNTGFAPVDSAPFEIAVLVYQGAQLMAGQVFYLNPLSDEIVIHEEVIKINSITEEQIRSFPPVAEVLPQLVDFLKPFCPPEKFVMAGYNTSFDYGMVSGLMFRHGISIGDLFSGRLIDVLELVKKAKKMGLIRYTENNKLETITKTLGIPHEDMHTALSDIKSTRLLYEAIYRLSR